MSSDSDSSSESSDEVQVEQPKPIAQVEDSDSSDSDSSDEAEAKPTPVAATKDDSDSSSDSDSDDEPMKEAPKPVAKEEDSDSDSDSSDEEEEKPAPKAVKKAAEDSDSSSDSSDEEDETPAPKKEVAKVAAEESDSSDSSDDEAEATKEIPKVAAPAAEDSDSDSSDSSDDEAEKPALVPKTSAPAAAESDSDSDSSDEEAEAEGAAEEPEKEAEPEFPVGEPMTVTPLFSWTISTPEKRVKKESKKKETSEGPKKHEKRVKKETNESKPEPEVGTKRKLENAEESASKKQFVAADHDLSQFKSAHLQGKSTTVFVRGIDINAYEKDVREFFKDIADPVEVRYKYDGNRPGLAWVQFSSPDLADRAVVEKNNEYILSRYVNTDWAEGRKNNAAGKPRGGPRNAHLKGTTDRIWMGNIHREVQKENIIELFSEIGEPTDVYLCGRDETRPKVAYVSFASSDLASKAVEDSQGSELMGQYIRLDWAEPRKNGGGIKRKRELSQKEEGCCTVFVGGLTEECTDEALVEFFKDCGEISDTRWIMKDGEFRGVAFVEFTETEATDKAVALNGEVLKGRNIRLDYAAARKKKEW